LGVNTPHSSLLAIRFVPNVLPQVRQLDADADAAKGRFGRMGAIGAICNIHSVARRCCSATL